MIEVLSPINVGTPFLVGEPDIQFDTSGIYEFRMAATPHTENVIGLPVPFDANASKSASHTAVALAFTPADSDKFVEISQIDWSYSAAPTGGGLTIAEGATTVFQLDIAAAGPKSIKFKQPRCARAKGDTMTVTLADGGVGITGKLDVHAWARI